MSEIWDQARLERYLTEGIEESLTLDYKAAASLDKSDKKKTEITKDVSAMANSAGGIIIYGLAEDATNKHLPGAIDPVDRSQISKEWLEQVISNIRPKIDGLVIYPVPISSAPSHVVYVVDIPQSHTAHQATDKRYYKRFNFQSEPMEDYELRDVMGRQQYARIELEFRILIHTVIESPIRGIFSDHNSFGRTKNTEPKTHTIYELKLRMKNIGKVYAQYIEAFIEMPCALIYDFDASRRKYFRKPPRKRELNQYCTYRRDNTVRDFIKGDGGIIGSPAEYGPARYVPLLPSISMKVDEFPLTQDFEEVDWGKHVIKWTTHADNAPPYSGEIAITSIEVIDQRNQTSDEDNDLEID